MLACVKCRRELRCIKNGVGLHFGNGHVYPGDMFRCPQCGFEIVNTGNVNAYRDDKMDKQDHYIEMLQGGL